MSVMVLMPLLRSEVTKSAGAVRPPFFTDPFRMADMLIISFDMGAVSRRFMVLSLES